MRYDINVIYYLVDEFCKIYLLWQKHRLISCNRIRLRDHLMSLSEMLTVMIIYHLSPCREFKFFYLYYLLPNHSKNFAHFVSYNHFVELMPLIILLHSLSGEKDGIYFIDSTKLQICE